VSAVLNPLAWAIAALRADPNIDPALTEVLPETEEPMTLEEAAYAARMDPENRPFQPCPWSDVR
jgi:hypothetical protein